MKNRIAIVVTSERVLGNTGKPTGFYLSEVAHPYYELESLGLPVDFISPKGGKAPVDPKSMDMKDPVNQRFEQEGHLSKLDHTLKASDADAANYGAVLFAGGHGTMWDFPDNGPLHRLARSVYEAGGVVAAVCHGPAALVGLKLADGAFLVNGKKVAAFTDDEEAASGLTDVVPFLLSSRLAEQGAMLQHAGLWKENAVTDGRLVTGQNPASAKLVGEAMAALLSQNVMAAAISR
jgi:putative intracellular protease/amidase